MRTFLIWVYVACLLMFSFAAPAGAAATVYKLVYALDTPLASVWAGIWLYVGMTLSALIAGVPAYIIAARMSR